jgi:hypothetical protein
MSPRDPAFSTFALDLVSRPACIALIVLAGHAQLSAQSIAELEEPAGYCTSSVCYQARPKAFELNYARIVDFSLASSYVDNDSLRFNTEVRRNRRIDVKAKLPLLNRPDWKLALGIGYVVENYSFEESSGAGKPLLDQLEERPLRSISSTLYIGRYFKHTYLLARVRASLDHDGVESPSRKDNPIKYSVAVTYGWKPNENTTYGGGFAFTYLTGRLQLLPVAGISHTFSPRFGIEALLPQSIKGRFNLSDKNLLYLAAEIDGANYNIMFSGQPLDGTFFLERSALRTYARFEHELHDWLWCGADVGLTHNLNLTLVTDHGVHSGRKMIGTDVGNALFFGASIFIVPPRKMMK